MNLSAKNNEDGTMKITAEMPEVVKCSAMDCAYNANDRCHAYGITVGGTNDHHCDTMFNCKPLMLREASAGVGACKVLDCSNNAGCECQAESISLRVSAGHADCMEYRAS